MSDLDNGPKQCIFMERFDLWRKQGDEARKAPQSCLSFFLHPFVGRLRVQAASLHDQISAFNESDTALMPVMRSHAVITWIHMCNLLEFAGFESRGDTETVILELAKAGGTPSNRPFSNREKEVFQMMALLKATYNSDAKLHGHHTFSIKDLCHWHSIAFEGLLPHCKNPHSFRSTGTRAPACEEIAEHSYPHHQLLDRFMPAFVYTCDKLAQDIDQLPVDTPDNRRNRFLHIFAFAAFAQFHFVDIHPFQDGNGRMCRLISKRILDAVCPVPFPMFSDRLRYLRAINAGRYSLNQAEAPLALMQLLIEEAIYYYNKLLQEYVHRGYDWEIYADSVEQVKARLDARDSMHKEDVERILQQFQNMPEDGAEATVTLPVSKHVVLLKRLECLDLNEL
jgi:hypothetical protein